MLSEISQYFHNIINSVNLSFTWTNIAEITVIVLVLYLFYKKFIKHTPSEKFVKGAFVLVFLWVFSEILDIFDLRILAVFLKALVALISLGLVVIFQPELRRLLGYLGQVDFFKKLFGNSDNVSASEEIDVIKEIIESVKYFSKSHTGALIVFQSDLSNTYYDVGTTLNADVSTELLLTIFHPNTPLHDGAVVINGNKIISAGVLLPLTEDPKLSWKYGTRHRAAIGMSEVSDSACLVVSEETGDVSITLDGTLKKYDDLVTLKADLEKILGVAQVEETKRTTFNLNNLIKKK